MDDEKELLIIDHHAIVGDKKFKIPGDERGIKIGNCSFHLDELNYIGVKDGKYYFSIIEANQPCGDLSIWIVDEDFNIVEVGDDYSIIKKFLN